MKLRVDRDRDTWYAYQRLDKDDTSVIRHEEKHLLADTYDGILDLMKTLGHEHDNAGWKQKLLMWNWHSISFDKFPGWEIETGAPPWAKIEHVNSPSAWKGGKLFGGRKGTKSSSDVCNAWDNIAQEQFYSRDLSYDGSVSVGNAEPYASLWWFRTAAERKRFLEWLPTFDSSIVILKESFT